jgi:hypothetical protein
MAPINLNSKMAVLAAIITLTLGTDAAVQYADAVGDAGRYKILESALLVRFGGNGTMLMTQVEVDHFVDAIHHIRIFHTTECVFRLRQLEASGNLDATSTAHLREMEQLIYVDICSEENFPTVEISDSECHHNLQLKMLYRGCRPANAANFQELTEAEADDLFPVLYRALNRWYGSPVGAGRILLAIVEQTMANNNDLAIPAYRQRSHGCGVGIARQISVGYIQLINQEWLAEQIAIDLDELDVAFDDLQLS